MHQYNNKANSISDMEPWLIRISYLSHLWVVGVDHLGQKNNDQQGQNHHHNLQEQQGHSQAGGLKHRGGSRLLSLARLTSWTSSVQRVPYILNPFSVTASIFFTMGFMRKSVHPQVSLFMK